MLYAYFEKISQKYALYELNFVPLYSKNSYEKIIETLKSQIYVT